MSPPGSLTRAVGPLCAASLPAVTADAMSVLWVEISVSFPWFCFLLGEEAGVSRRRAHDGPEMSPGPVRGCGTLYRWPPPATCRERRRGGRPVRGPDGLPLSRGVCFSSLNVPLVSPPKPPQSSHSTGSPASSALLSPLCSCRLCAWAWSTSRGRACLRPPLSSSCRGLRLPPFIPPLPAFCASRI